MVVSNNLIGISGKIGNGKDLLFDIINYLAVENDWNSFEHYMSESNKTHEVYDNTKFAYPIKWITSVLIGCDIRQLEDREFKNKELPEEWWYYTNSLFEGGNRILESYIGASEKLHDNLSWYIYKLTPRKLLQLLGTEAGRQIIHPNIWVNALFADWKSGYVEQGAGWIETEDDYPNWIITDVRFPNEAQAIKDRGGIVIRINRFSEEQKIALLKIRARRPNNSLELILKDEHSSETGLDDYSDFDYVIENDGTVQDLIDKVRALNIVQKIS